VVDSTNNRVGVGTATPSAALDVTGDVSIADKIIHTGDTNTAIRFPAADTVTVETGGSERMRIDDSGRVNVAATTGNEKLNVAGALGVSGASANFSGGNERAIVDFTGTLARFGHVNGSSGSAKDISVLSGGSEKFRFGSSGQLGIGGATYGTSGQVLTSGGSGSAPSWADAAGGGGQFDAVASGAIGNGVLVSLNRDGTVSTTTQAVGNTTEYHSNSTTYIGAAFDSNTNKIVVAYRDSGAIGKAAVGTVSGNSITFGTAVNFNGSNSNARGQYIKVLIDGKINKPVILFSDDGASGDKLKGVVGTISGTSISFGTVATLDNSGAVYIDAVYDPDQQQIICVYKDTSSGGGYGAVNVLECFGTTIGTEFVASPFGNNESSYNRVIYDTNANKAVFFCIDGGIASDGGRGRAVVGTNSGTGMTFGTVTTFNLTGDNAEEAQQALGAAFDSTANKCVIAFRDGRDSNSGKAKVGTVSGTSITFGNPTKFNLGNTTEINATYDSTTNRTFITFRDDGDSDKGVVNSGFISGTDIFFSGKIAYFPSTGNSKENVPVIDSNAGRLVVFMQDTSDSNHGKAIVCNPVGVDNFLNWIGISQAAISNSATGTITVVGGVSENQSSLVIGAKHYLQDNATISSTEITGREVGKALSATKLLITQGSVS
jgi:hypothetical protein